MNPRTPASEELSDDDIRETLKRHDEPLIGPSDSSDSGADSIGLGRGDDTSDRNGTGERGSVGEFVEAEDAADTNADRIVEAEEAGLGGGLDQAEEAELGVTDEELTDLENDAEGG